MKRLCLLFASLACIAGLALTPALAAVTPSDHQVVAVPADCPSATAAFAIDIQSPAADAATCEAALLAETGLCVVAVAPARAGYAFTLSPEHLFSSSRTACSPGRSPPA